MSLHEALEEEFTAVHGELPSDFPRSADPQTQLKAFCDAVHSLEEKRAALCISGGGIRSATFGLGVLQGLAHCGLLGKFHYLCTVSGGGYIGSWLSAWIKNHPQGIRGVIAELKRRPESTLDPEPQPIRHLREFSNYLSPRAGLTSVDFWTLITTFIRNMSLNWLVLISWLAAAMMIPRLYLAAINLQPDWAGLGTLHSWYLLANNCPPDWGWDAWKESVKYPWNIALTVLLAVGFGLIAVAMAYAVIDVPSTGNARWSQRRFLKYRQLPLLLASLILAEWWALFRSVHGDEPFRPKQLVSWFVGFTLASYVCGGIIAWIIRLVRKQKARRGGAWRFAWIVVTAALAGFCLWAMATRMFLDHKQIEFAATRDCEAIQIRSGETIALPKGTTGVITQTIEGRYTIGILGDNQAVRIAEKDLDLSKLNPTVDPQTGLQTFTFTSDCPAIKPVPANAQ